MLRSGQNERFNCSCTRRPAITNDLQLHEYHSPSFSIHVRPEWPSLHDRQSTFGLLCFTTITQCGAAQAHLSPLSSALVRTSTACTDREDKGSDGEPVQRVSGVGDLGDSATSDHALEALCPEQAIAM